MLSRAEMLSIAKAEYEAVRGAGRWEVDRAERKWRNNDFLYLTEKIVRMMAANQAKRYQPTQQPSITP